jgi:hypothetical protein
MQEFVQGLQDRAAQAAASLATARTQGDDYAVDVLETDLLDVTRLAQEHGIDLRDGTGRVAPDDQHRVQPA